MTAEANRFGRIIATFKGKIGSDKCFFWLPKMLKPLAVMNPLPAFLCGLAVLFSLFLLTGEQSAAQEGSSSAGGIVAPDAPSAAVSALKVFAEEWPPVSYSENGQAGGMAVEVVREMLKRAGRNEEVEIVPWSRGYSRVTQVPNVLLFAAGRNVERERLLTLIGPLLLVKTELYQRRGERWIDRLELARQKAVVGVYRASYFETSARNNGFQLFSLAANPDRSARMLLSGRVDLWADSNVSSGAIIMKAGGNPADIERIMTLDVTEMMLAISPGTPESIIQTLERALRAMKSDGSFQRIYRRWFPDDSAPHYVIRVGLPPQ